MNKLKIKYKKLSIFFSFVLIIILLSNIFGYSNKNYKPKYGITTANLNLRFNTSNTRASIIKVVKKGTRIKMIGEVNNFYIIQLASNEIGLLSKSYIKSTSVAPSGAKVYTNLAKFYATINGNNTIVRGGPSTSFRKITKLDKGTKIQVIGKINSWYLVITEHNYTGMIRSDLITKVTTTNTTTNQSTATQTNVSNQQMVINLINAARVKKGLSKLTINWDLQRIAQIKVTDMVSKKYFLHTSPTYGTPFEMMKNNGITYNTAGENIAGNPSITAAVNAWIASEQHSKNIFSTSYNYIGVGVEKSDIYGYIISAMFIGK